MQLKNADKTEDFRTIRTLRLLGKSENVLATCKKEIDMECGGYEVGEVVLITKEIDGLFVVSKVEYPKRVSSFAIKGEEIPTYFKI